MKSNLKVRAFENANIYGRHFKKALGFTYRLSTDYKSELYVVVLSSEEGSDKLAFLGGDGHIRMSVKDTFKLDLGSESPEFSKVFAFYSALEECPTEKGVVLKHCCR